MAASRFFLAPHRLDTSPRPPPPPILQANTRRRLSEKPRSDRFPILTLNSQVVVHLSSTRVHRNPVYTLALHLATSGLPPEFRRHQKTAAGFSCRASKDGHLYQLESVSCTIIRMHYLFHRPEKTDVALVSATSACAS